MPDIQIKALDGTTFGAYLSPPKGNNGPVMIVIQEIFGVNAAMRSICDDFASRGYIAVCPDLFWRQKPGIQLTDQTPAEWERAFELYKNFDVEAGVRDLLSTLAHARKLPGCSGKVGSVGYCLGGKLAYLMSTRSDVDASVSYYAVGLESMLDEVHEIRMPYVMHIAGLDKFVQGTVRQQILDAVSKNPVIKTYLYEGVDHAFARPNGQSYNKEAAELANQRTFEFFAEHLQS